jgi:heat shock protein HslJ
MTDDEIRDLLAAAPEQFPVHGWPDGLLQQAGRRRRIVLGLTTAVGALVVAGVSAAVLAVAGLAPFHTATPAATAGYIGSRWSLASVADGSTTTAIRADVGAWLELFPSGEILIEDGTNAHDGRFTVSGDQLTVGSVSSTFVMYDGTDPVRSAALAGLNTLAYGNAVGTTPDGPVIDTVVTVDATQLIVRAGPMRLTFRRSGPALPFPTARAT